MRFRALLFIGILVAVRASAQDNPPGYKLSPDFPQFELQRADNSVFRSEKIRKNIPTAIIFFSPTCEHCQHQIEWMLKRSKDLRKYQFVMATYQPLEELDAFNKKYHLSRYPNIITGRDSNYFFPPFYQIHNFPYLAFYDRHGKLLSTNEGNMTVDNMIKKFDGRN